MGCSSAQPRRISYSNAISEKAATKCALARSWEKSRQASSLSGMGQNSIAPAGKRSRRTFPAPQRCFLHRRTQEAPQGPLQFPIRGPAGQAFFPNSNITLPMDAELEILRGLGLLVHPFPFVFKGFHGF